MIVNHNSPDHPWQETLNTGRRTADQRAAIVAYYLDGHSVRATAEHFGCCERTVRRYVRDAGHADALAARRRG